MKTLERLIAVWAPHTCVGCGSEGALLCYGCCRSLESVPPRCYRCLAPNEMGETCPACRQLTPLSRTISAVKYAGAAKALLARLKFERAQSGAEEIAALLAVNAQLKMLPTNAVLVPVPTATSRVRQRGYDQAVLIARSLAVRLDRPYAPLLVRSGHTQQHGATRKQRFQQSRQSYELLWPSRVKGADIVLVDDVLTTGATLEAAAISLGGAGACSVIGLTFARA